jgi:hypothetical protein
MTESRVLSNAIEAAASLPPVALEAQAARVADHACRRPSSAAWIILPAQ